jgi:hypothetical protein
MVVVPFLSVKVCVSVLMLVTTGSVIVTVRGTSLVWLEVTKVVMVPLPIVTVWLRTSVLITVCVVTMVLSVAEKVTEQGPVVVLFWYGALELMDPERVVVRLQGRVEDAEPVVLL